MANVNIRLGNKSSAWFTANPTLVLLDGQLVYLDDQSGKYKKGDGTTQLSALSFLGGGGSVSGTTNRITVTGSTIDIASTYVGQTTINTLGTIATGVWQGTSIGTGYTDAKIKGAISTNQIGFGSGSDTLAGSNDFTFNNSTKLAYLNGRIGIGVAAVSDTLVSLKSTGNTGFIYVGQFYNSDNNLVTRLSSIYTGSITGLSTTGTAFAHSVGMYGFTSFGQNEIYNGANSYGIDSRALIRFHTSSSHQFMIGEGGATWMGIYTNTGSNWAFQIDTAGDAYLNNRVHVRGYDATWGLAPLTVYAKSAAQGYNYGWSAAINVIPVGASCYPVVMLRSGGTSSFSSIVWQDSGYDSLTGSTAGNQAYIYSYNSGGKGLFVLGVNNNIGTTAPTTVLTALGNALTVGSSGGSIGLYGVTPIARPTTSYAAATFVQNSGSAVYHDSTFDGYTIQQIAKALRDLGILT